MSAKCSGKIRSVNPVLQNFCTWTYYFHKPACVHLIRVVYMCIVNRNFRVCTCPWTISSLSFITLILFCNAVINLCSIKLYHNIIFASWISLVLIVLCTGMWVWPWKVMISRPCSSLITWLTVGIPCITFWTTLYR